MYCGKVETHDYQLYLALKDIEHTKTKARHPRTNSTFERFHNTILKKFYQPSLRREVYLSVDELQIYLDEWLEYYNNKHTHKAKQCCGRPPCKSSLMEKQF